MVRVMMAGLLWTILAAGCSHQERSLAQYADGSVRGQPMPQPLAEDASGRHKETPAALGILRERISEKHDEERRLDERLAARQAALAQATEDWQSLQQRIRQAEATQRDFQGLQTRVERLGREEAALQQQLSRTHNQQQQMLDLYGQQIAAAEARLREANARGGAQDQHPAHAVPAVPATERNKQPREDHEPPAPPSGSGRHQTERTQIQNEARRHVQQLAVVEGCRAIEIRDGSRPSGTVIKRAAAQGGAQAFWYAAEQAAGRVYVKVWTDKQTRIMYYALH
jgi:hypothetical protein